MMFPSVVFWNANFSFCAGFCLIDEKRTATHHQNSFANIFNADSCAGYDILRRAVILNGNAETIRFFP